TENISKTYNVLSQKYKKKSSTHYSSYKGQVGKVSPNKVKRNFKPKTFNQLWVTDVTEFALPIKGKKLYLSTIMDCYNSEVIAYQLSRSPNLAIAINPLNK